MNKNTLTFERKLYVAPACKTHVLQVEENIMSGGDGWSNANSTPSIIDEDPDDDTKNFGF